MNTFKCNKKILSEIEPFYCSFRVTENISKFFLVLFQGFLPPRKSLRHLPVLCHSFRMRSHTVYSVFSIEKGSVTGVSKKLYLLCTMLGSQGIALQCKGC